MGKQIKRGEQLAVVHPNDAGLDIGSREIYACVPPNQEGKQVKWFGTFTPDLRRLGDWLVQHGVERSRWNRRAYFG